MGTDPSPPRDDPPPPPPRPRTGTRVDLTNPGLPPASPAPAPTPAAARVEIEGYRILEELGRGGMGAVYLAEDTRLGRRVAIKVLSREFAGHAQFLTRFRREAEAAGAIHHPNVLLIHKAGETRGVPYLVTELCTGGTLWNRIERGGPLPWREAAGFGAQIARALAAVHAVGLVHRDVKPANVFLDSEGRAKLGDFGLVRREWTDDLFRSVALTRPGEVLGSPLYMAPEQALGAAVDSKTDLYSLGITLYELLTGDGPFLGEQHELAAKHVMEKPRPPSERAPVPQALDRLVLRLLAKKPHERPESAEAVALELERLARPPANAAAPPGAFPTLAPDPLLEPRPVRRGVLVLVGLAALVLLATGILLFLRVHPTTTTLAPAPLASPTIARTPSPRPTPVPAPSPPPAPISPRTSLRLERTWGTYAWKHARSINAVAFSPDGQLVVSGCNDGTVRLWDATATSHGGGDTNEVRALVGHTQAVTAVALSPVTSQALSASMDGSVRVWATDSGEARVLRPHGGHGVRTVAYLPDGKKALSGGDDGKVAVLDLTSGEVERSLAHGAGSVSSVAVSEDAARAVSAGADGRLVLWDLATGGVLRRLAGHTKPVTAVALSPDGAHAVSGSLDRTVRLWDVRDGKCLGVLETVEPVHSVSLSPDGRECVVGVGTWKEKENVLVVSLAAAQRGEGPLTVTKVPHHWSEVYAVAFSPRGRLVATAGNDRRVTLWDLAKLAHVRFPGGHSSAVTAVAVSPTGDVASGGQDGDVRVWTRSQVAELWDEGDESGKAVAFSRDGALLTSGDWDHHELHLRDAATGKLLRSLAPHPKVVEGLQVTADGLRAVSSAEDGVPRVWDLATGNEVGRLEGRKGEVTALALSADGRRVLLGGEESLTLWDTVDQELELARPDGTVHAAALSPDGLFALVATGAQGGLALRDLEGKTAEPLRAHERPVRAVAFSPDGTRALSAGDDRRIVLWDVKAREPLATVLLDATVDLPLALAFDPSGASFAVGTARGVVLLYAIVGP